MNGHPEPLTLSQYLDDALAPEARASVDAHLGTCAACAGRTADLGWLDRAVRDLPVPPVPATMFVLTEAGAARQGLWRSRMGALIPLPARARRPVGAGGGALLRPQASWWVAPTAALALAAGVLVVSVSLICRGYPSLAACADGWPGATGQAVTQLPAPAVATAIVRLGPPGLAPAWPAAVAPGDRPAAPAGGPGLDRTAITATPPYPGPPAVPVAGILASASETPLRAADGGSSAYPGPAGPVRVATQLAPALRKTEAAVAAGLATLAADGGLVRLFLPRTDAGS
jgi:hypothetical protein